MISEVLPDVWTLTLTLARSSTRGRSPRCVGAVCCQKALKSAHPQVSKGPIIEGQLGHAAPVPVGQRLWRAVASSQGVLLRQQGLQLWCGSSRHQRPDQRQDVVIEVRLQTRRNDP